MSIRSNRFLPMKILISALMAIVLFLLINFPANAASNTTTTTKATIVVNGGARTIDTNESVTLPNVPLSGQQQITSVQLDNLKLIDASGTGTGWRVDVSASPVKAGDKTLNTGLLKIDKIQSAEKVDVTSSDVPQATTNGQAIVDNGVVTLLKADIGDGMGSYKVNMGKVYLTVPANTYAGTYSANLTYSLVTAP